MGKKREIIEIERLAERDLEQHPGGISKVNPTTRLTQHFENSQKI